jgi:hypothetical protein
MKKVTIKSTGIAPQKWRELRAIAHHSLYRMNCPGDDCYAFTVERGGEYHLDGSKGVAGDFEGGWDNSKHLIQGMRYIYMLDGSGVFEV